jgi:hypothetical protein
MANYGRYSAALAILFVSVYFANLAYKKLVSDGFVDAIGGFQGMTPVQQVVVLLLMSTFFVVFVLDRSNQAA